MGASQGSPAQSTRGREASEAFPKGVPKHLEIQLLASLGFWLLDVFLCLEVGSVGTYGVGRGGLLLRRAEVGCLLADVSA